MALSETGHNSSRKLSLSFLMSLMTLCTKHARRVSYRLKSTTTKSISAINHRRNRSLYDDNYHINIRSPKSPLVKSKELLTQLSNKAINVVHKKRVVREEEEICGPDEFGDGGVWQREILMGDKCQPLDFSGVIYYDSNGKQVNELPPRSPRASPLPGYMTRNM